MRRSATPVRALKDDELFDSIITMNAGGFIQSASDSVEQVFGWTPIELFGQNVRMLVPEPRRSVLDRYLDRYRLSDQAKMLERTRQFDAVRKDGKDIRIELSMSRADLPANAPPYFIGIVREVRSRTELGTKCEIDRSRLRRIITEQTRSLATANLRLHLADRLASMGTLAAGLGHDMNNILLPIRARLNAIEHAGVSASARVHLVAVRQSIAHLQHLSDGLHFLAVDPEGAGGGKGPMGSTSIADWWAQVGALLHRALPSTITLRVAIAARLPPARIAPQWLTQAMLNLFVNAGESIAKDQVRPHVRLSVVRSADGKMIEISVRDNGRGMAPGVLRRAFDLFFTTKSRSIGTGLGLPLARRVAIRAGGELILESEPGRGTTATLSIPVASTAVGAGQSRACCVAVVTVNDPRAATLISQVLVAAGVHVRGGDGPGQLQRDIWVTDPTPDALRKAQGLRRRDAEVMVVLLGVPAKRTRSAWEEVKAESVADPSDFGAVRLVLETAIDRWNDNKTKEVLQ